MLFRLISLDIDGTLTDSHKRITSYTRSRLIKFQKNGGVVVLASGRPTEGILPYARILRLREFGGYILAYNGGAVIDCRTGDVLFRNRFPLSLIPAICDIIKDYPVGINTYQDGTILVGNQINDYTKLEARINGLPLQFTEDFPAAVNFPIVKCLLQGEPTVIRELEELLSARFGDRIGVFKSEPYFLEMVPKGIDKAASLDKLLHHIGITTDECIAFGDGFNDISMIRYAGLGIAMSNAAPPVKQAADYITASNDEDGIGRLLTKMGRSVFPSLAML